MLSENLSEFLMIVDRHPLENKYVLGFSFGALIPLLASTKFTFRRQILCSLSPCFKEDLAVMKPSWKRAIGKHRASDLMEICSMEELAHVKTPTTIMVGEREPKEIMKRSRQVYAALNAEKQFVVVEGTRHNLSDERYLTKLTMIIPSIARDVGGESPSRGQVRMG
jgi:alpha/beta superfamily hydrolase